MNVFDRLFPRRSSPVATRSQPVRGRNRLRELSCGERLEERLPLTVDAAFAPRWTLNVTGDITFAANTLMTAVVGQPGTAAQVADAKDGTGSNSSVWNDDFWNMQYVNIDSSGGTFNSSAADLLVPSGAEVLWAGLYWGGRASTSVSDVARETVKFKKSGDPAGYTTLHGTNIGSIANDAINGVQTYQSFAVVTDLVTAGGAGNYTVADVQAQTGNNRCAGWSLVVAYRHDGDPARNLTVFDGFASVTTSDPAVSILIDGFKAPPSGPVNAELGFISYEGDLGLIGDTARLNGTTLTNATNPSNNFFNSSISTNGVSVSTKNPNYLNQLGYDADILQLPTNLISNGATTATLELNTTQDFYYPGVVTSAIEYFAPKVTVAKTVVDKNGGVIQPGDTLVYTVTVTNNDNQYGSVDNATNVILTDAIPTNTAYTAGTLKITAGANNNFPNQSQTDAADVDQGEKYNTGNGVVQFQLGTGATGTPGFKGGTLKPGESTTVTFEVTVNQDFPSGALISNTANVSYTSTFSKDPLNASATANISCPQSTITVQKSNGQTSYLPGQTLTYTIVVANDGPGRVSDAKVTDVFSTNPNIASVSWVASATPGSSVTPSGPLSTDINATANLAKGGVATFIVTAVVKGTATGDLVNTVSVTPQKDPFAPVSSTDTDKLRSLLTVTKTDGRTNYLPGDTVTYTILVSNTGNGAVTGATVSDIFSTNPNIASWTWTASASAGSSVTPTGPLTTDINATVNLAVGGTATFTVTAVTKTTATTDLVNTVTVTPPAGTGDPVSSTDTDKMRSLLTVSKTDGQTNYLPGDTVVYTIVVSNTGNWAVNGATVSDIFSTNPNIASWTWNAVPTVGSSVVPPTSGTNTDINATVNLAVGGSVTFTVTALTKTTATTDLVNTVTVTPPAGRGDPVSSTDTDKIRSLLTVSKTDGQTNYLPGDTVTYSIVVSNTGNWAVNGATVSDIFSTNPNIASWTWNAVPTAGSSVTPSGPLSTDINATVNLAVGGSVTFTVTAVTKTSATTDLVNTVTVTPPRGTGDPISSTDTDKIRSLLTVTKTDGQENFLPGDTVTYSIVVSNTGNWAVTGANVSDIFSTNPNIASWTWTASASAGSSVTPTGPLSTDISATVDLAVGGTATFTVTALTKTTAATDLVNTVTVTPPEGRGDPVSSTDTDRLRSVLTVSKDDGRTSYVPGDTVVYTILVTNTGNGAVNGANVKDVFSTNTNIASWSWTASASVGSSVVPPTIGTNTDIDATVNLAVGGTATFTVTAVTKSTATGDLVNTVTVTPPQGTGDPVSSTDTDKQSNPLVKFGVTKTDGKDRYLPGDTLIYTIVVSNSGPSFLKGATVTDLLPSPQGASGSWTVSSVTGIGSSVTPTSGGDNIVATVDLAAGGTATFVYTVKVTATAFGQLDNTVTITPPTGVTVDPTSVLKATDSNFGPEPPLGITGGLVVGSDDGCNGLPYVRVLDQTDGTILSQFLAYEPSFRGSVRVATGDVNGDGTEEIIVAPGRNRVGEIRVFTAAGVELQSYRTYPFGTAYRGGVEVALQNINGAKALVAGMSSGAGTVSTFLVNPAAADPVANSPFRSFRGFPPTYSGGVKLATGDFNLDGTDEIVVGSNAGRRALVRTFDVTGVPTVVRSIQPFGMNFSGGVSLSVGRYNADLVPDVFIGAGVGGKSMVEVYSGSSSQQLAKLAAFAGFKKPNATVFTALLDTTGDGIVDNIYGVQGLNGGGGSTGVRDYNRTSGTTSTLAKSTSITPPLRIAAIKLPVVPPLGLRR